MSPIRTFQSRLFVILLLAVLVPLAAALLSGAVAMREVVRAGGTVGPWAAVGESGAALLDLLEGSEDEELRAAAERHRVELSESLRLSHLYAFVANRFLDLLLPLTAALVLLSALVAFAAARLLSRQLSAPVEELVDWTGRIARREPLPAATSRDRDLREFQRLRVALRKMDSELRQARAAEEERIRMRSWTEMARRVAHELKNPLTPMRMAARRVRGHTDDRVREAGEVLLEEIDRLDEMARSFSNFARPPEGPSSTVDLEELLGTLTRRHGTDRIQMEASQGVGALPPLRGHPEALERVFRNLLVNALDAVESVTDGGRGGPPVRVHTSREGHHVRVSIRDAGPGIPDVDLHRIWDPDFTTKRRGTGLGLALVRKTVEAHGGKVEARNHPAGGAEFVVRLPVVDPAPAPEPSS